MVAFHIHNTKAKLRLLLIFFTLSFFGCISTNKTRHSNCDEISEYIQLDLAFYPDTIHYQKPFKVLLTFTNVSDSIISFYPITYTCIDRTWDDTAFINYEDLNYVKYELCDINEVNLDSIVHLAPNTSYNLNYDLQANDIFFTIKDESVKCFCNTGGYVGNTFLCGNIWSKPVRLLIIQ